MIQSLPPRAHLTLSATAYPRRNGRNAAYRSLFGHFARELEGPEREHAAALAQLTATRLALRDLSRKLGCDDWPDNLHLADVVEKHIGRSDAITEFLAANEELGK